MQCKWCVIRVVVNDVKYYCFRGENLKGLDNNHTQNSFLHFLTDNISIFLEAHPIGSGFCIWLSKALHISYLISWDLHCEIWFERKLSMVIIVIHFILQWQTKTKQVSQNIYPQSTNLYFSYFSYQISQTDAQPFFLNWLQSSLDILGTDESKNRTFPN